MLYLFNKSKKNLTNVDHKSVCYQIFKLYIYKEDFGKAYEYFLKFNNKNFIFDQLFYILLNYLLGNKIRRVKNIVSFKGSMVQLTEVKSLCINHDFELAFSELEQLELNNDISESKIGKSRVKILKILLNKCTKKQANLLENIFDFYSNTEDNFEIACLQYGLDVYQINILKLLIAKNYYLLNDFENGDLYYYSVLSSDYQNDITKSLIGELDEKENLGNSIITSRQINKLSRKKVANYFITIATSITSKLKTV